MSTNLTPHVLVVSVVFRRIPDGAHVARNVRGKRFAADMLQIVCRVMAGGAVGRVLFVMAVMAVGSVNQRSRHLKDAANVDEKERRDGQRASRRDGSRCGGADVRFMLAALQERQDLAQRNLAEQVAEEDEEEQRPEERDEAVGMLLERGAEYFDTQEFEDRFEEVRRAARRVS